MSYTERSLQFECMGDELLGIVTTPKRARCAETGLLIVVGGPQYRAGSHRMFVLLARRLASNGIPCLRFDFRGMGDSTGDARRFDETEDDIRVAIDAFMNEIPGLRTVVLWGLCDGATAASLYSARDPRVGAVMLVNPSIETEIGKAQTRLRYYYPRRILQSSLWIKLFSGRLPIIGAVKQLFGTIRRAGSADELDDPDAHPADRMAHALEQSNALFSIFLSGKDAIAREFNDIALSGSRWRRLCARNMVSINRAKDANHTLARTDWLVEAAEHTETAVLSFQDRQGLSVEVKSE